VRLDLSAWSSGAQRAANSLHGERPAIVAARLVEGGRGPLAAGGTGAAATAAGGSAPRLVVATSPLAAPTFFIAPYVREEDASQPIEQVLLTVPAPAARGAAGAAAAAAAASGADAGADAADAAEAHAGADADAADGLKAGKIGKVAAVVDARGATAARSSLRDESGGASAGAAAAPARAAAGTKRPRPAEDAAAPPAAGGADDGWGALLGEGEGVAGGDGGEGVTLGQRLRGVIAALRDPAASDITSAAAGSGESALVGAAMTPSAPSGSLASALASMGSLAVPLSQALGARDEAAIESVLAAGSDRAVRDATAARLPTSDVLPFLARLVARLASKPSRGYTLLPWVRALLAAHAAALIALPALAPALEGL
jgi:hypothetical protein